MFDTLKKAVTSDEARIAGFVAAVATVTAASVAAQAYVLGTVYEWMS
jgi:hypothetical protein